MSDKLTIKQENFCQAYIETGNASEAYRLAYNAGNMKPETINRKAQELMDGERGGGKIAARISKLQKGHQKRHEVTVDSLTKELEEARQLGTKNNQTSAVVQAVMGKAKIHGHGRDDKTISIRRLDDMTEDQLLDFLDGEPTAEEFSAATGDKAPGKA